MVLKNNKYKHLNLFQSALSATRGLFHAFNEERNLKIDLFVLFFMLLIMMFLKFSIIENVICLLNWALVVSLEIVNTVFERLIDKTLGTAYNTEIKKMKDMTAAAVFFLSLTLVIIIIIISITKF